MTKVAFLWDESFLWGLMAWKSFAALGIDAGIVTSEDVRAGALEAYDILFVPGGWASDKTVALGDDGRDAVRDFVGRGGSYMGFCGGAGLALDVDGGLALTHVSRIPTKHRVPSFSGEVVLRAEEPSHQFWRGIRKPFAFHVWWPGQFHLGDGDGIKVIASYAGPGRDFCLADLDSSGVGRYCEWGKWEESYGINLNPERLVGEPAIIETGFSAGRVFLSYPHLETPGSRKGNRALLNLVEYLKPKGKGKPSPPVGWYKRHKPGIYKATPDAVKASADMLGAAREFIRFGERNFLWYWRNSWVLQWRRGVRGVEYSMLFGLIKEIAERLKAEAVSSDPDVSGKVIALKDRVVPFFEDAKSLLLLERLAMMNGGMSSIKSHDPEVERLRARLFSNSKRFGGEFKEILVKLDEVVLSLLSVK